MDTTKPFMDTASPIVQDVKDSSKSQLQSPESGLTLGEPDANTAVASSSPLDLADATVSACTKHKIQGADYGIVTTCSTGFSSCGGAGSSQQHIGVELSGTQGLNKNQRRKLRKRLLKATATESNFGTKRPRAVSSASHPGMQKRMRKDVQPWGNLQSQEGVQPWENLQSQVVVQPQENFNQEGVKPWENLQNQEGVQPRENLQSKKHAQPGVGVNCQEHVQPQQAIQLWQGFQPRKDVQPRQGFQPRKDVQPRQGFQPRKNVQPCQGVQLREDIQRSENVQSSPPTKIAIMKRDYPHKLSSDDAESILREILVLTDAIPIEAKLPKIISNHLVKGALILQCGDVATVKWISSKFSNNSKVLGDAALKVLNADELPKPVKVAFKTKETFSDPSAFLRRLQRLNPGLKSTEWRVLQHTAVQNYVRWILEVDSEDVEVIRRADFGAFTGVDRGVFKILHDPNQKELLETKHTVSTVPPAPENIPVWRQGLW